MKMTSPLIDSYDYALHFNAVTSSRHLNIERPATLNVEIEKPKNKGKKKLKEKNK